MNTIEHASQHRRQTASHRARTTVTFLALVALASCRPSASSQRHGHRFAPTTEGRFAAYALDMADALVESCSGRPHDPLWDGPNPRTDLRGRPQFNESTGASSEWCRHDVNVRAAVLGVRLQAPAGDDAAMLSANVFAFPDGRLRVGAIVLSTVPHAAVVARSGAPLPNGPAGEIIAWVLDRLRSTCVLPEPTPPDARGLAPAQAALLLSRGEPLETLCTRLSTLAIEPPWRVVTLDGSAWIDAEGGTGMLAARFQTNGRAWWLGRVAVVGMR